MVADADLPRSPIETAQCSVLCSSLRRAFPTPCDRSSRPVREDRSAGQRACTAVRTFLLRDGGLYTLLPLGLALRQPEPRTSSAQRSQPMRAGCPTTTSHSDSDLDWVLTATTPRVAECECAKGSAVGPVLELTTAILASDSALPIPRVVVVQSEWIAAPTTVAPPWLRCLGVQVQHVVWSPRALRKCSAY